MDSAPIKDDRIEPNTQIGEPDLSRWFSRQRVLSLGLSVVSFLVCGLGAVLHYLKLAWGNPWQLTGWLLSMLFLLLAFAPSPGKTTKLLRASANWKTTAFFIFWILIFIISHLWNFRTAPWNGDALFDESGWDLYFLKHYVIGHPYQAAWFHPPWISRETLFHYFVWLFFRLFGYNILSYEAAQFVIWCAIFFFTLLLVHLLFESWTVTSVTALIFNFLPFSFIYTFTGYRYSMGTALCLGSLYFLHLGFKIGSAFSLSLGGIAAGLCLASSITGKQYLLVLLLFGIVYAAFHWRSAKAHFKWSVPIVAYGCLTAAAPILCYIAFNRHDYTVYEAMMLDTFWKGVLGKAPPALSHFTTELWNCFFGIPGPRFFLPDTLPIPLPYYALLLPGIILALRRRRYEIVLLATLPVVAAFVSSCFENRLLLPIPFWIILMGFTFAGLTRLRWWIGYRIALWSVAILTLSWGIVPSVRYIYSKTKDPTSIRFYSQDEVATSRFLKNIVAGRGPLAPRFERNEFNRISGIPDPAYDTLICPLEAYSILHLFLHDYGDEKILSLTAGWPVFVLPEQHVWSTNKHALVTYVATGKDLKIIWERSPRTERMINMFKSLQDLGTEESLSFSSAGKVKSFYVLNIGKANIDQLKQRAWALPDNLP
jgi:hypothetical protein